MDELQEQIDAQFSLARALMPEVMNARAAEEATRRLTHLVVPETRHGDSANKLLVLDTLIGVKRDLRAVAVWHVIIW